MTAGPLSSTPLVVGRNAHTEAFFQLIAKGHPTRSCPSIPPSGK